MEMLSTAIVLVGLQIPPLQLMSLVVPGDIVTLAPAGAIRSASNADTPSAQTTAGQRNDLVIDVMDGLPSVPKFAPSLIQESALNLFLLFKNRAKPLNGQMTGGDNSGQLATWRLQLE
jgi:hypothetical protein